MFLVAVFLILLVLVQRGRGGGLAGALGGMGGQSAFGAKAGDVFTRITVGVAAVWILLSVVAVVMLRDRDSGPTSLQGSAAAKDGPGETSIRQPVEPIGDDTSGSAPTGGAGEGASDSDADPNE